MHSICSIVYKFFRVFLAGSCFLRFPWENNKTSNQCQSSNFSVVHCLCSELIASLKLQISWFRFRVYSLSLWPVVSPYKAVGGSLVHDCLFPEGYSQLANISVGRWAIRHLPTRPTVDTSHPACGSTEILDPQCQPRSKPYDSRFTPGRGDVSMDRKRTHWRAGCESKFSSVLVGVITSIQSQNSVC